MDLVGPVLTGRQVLLNRKPLATRLERLKLVLRGYKEDDGVFIIFSDIDHMLEIIKEWENLKDKEKNRRNAETYKFMYWGE